MGGFSNGGFQLIVAHQGSEDETQIRMDFKLCQSASKKWRRLDGSHHIAEIIQGVKFKDGEKLIERTA